ncbi:uncharacterized protein LOC126894402 isoform X4 [Daktulosphaira vitifoliae]|uniref:uncharacterized protein LOC126894402 isoform X4 n=1 Tax=Daktulosphaira vitifoliae TaxID=58002 RepID=UPI0021AA593E|nr:uncharacterized protein LOC126894402 isoform X4 [Daktulosphaira vitifoliae]
MNLIILIILLKSLSSCIGLSPIELQCNFSKYMLNFFNHNEKYLLNLEQRNNIQPVDLEDLNTYGAVLKTHGEIIMAMLDALRPLSSLSTANDLMAINLYLNNVSGSLNFITRNCSGKYNRNLSNVLRGYQLHHRTIVDELNEYINNKCTNVTVDEDFIKCPDYNKSGIYNIKDLPKISEKLKNRFTNYYTNNMINSNDIFNALFTSLNSKKYNDFDPKNLLFFDLLNHDVDYRPLTINGQKFTLMKSNKKLDLLRYANLNIKCPNNSYLNITDVFQYMLYSFDAHSMHIFQELVMAASIKPLVALVRTFGLFAEKLLMSFNLGHIERNEVNFDNLVKVSEEIVNNLDLLMHLTIIKEAPAKLLKTIIDVFKIVHDRYKLKIINNSYILKNVIGKVHSFLRGNKLHCTIDTNISNKIYGSNFDSLFSIIEKYSQKVTAYITELKKFEQLFLIVHGTYFFSFLYVGGKKCFIRDDIIEYICNQSSYTNLISQNNEIDIQRETKNEVDKKDEFVFDVEEMVNNLYTEIVESSETTNQKVEFVSCTSLESQSKNRPEYIKDYLLFNDLN